MKKRIVISFVFLIAFYNGLFAQGIENVIASGRADASTYLGNYMQPIFKGLIYNLNNGWYTTGKVHKKYGFDLTINASASFVSDADKLFTFNNSNYTVLSLAGTATTTNLPTAMGGQSTQIIDVRIPVDILGNQVPLGSHVGFKVADFKTINGIEQDLKDATGYAAIPSPMIQFGLGLPSKTDLKIRFVPKVGSDEVKFNMFGFGLQHDIMQHFRKSEADKKYKFDLSVLAAFTTMKTVYSPANSSIGVNQETTIKIDAYTAQAIASYNLKIINFYAGFGYTAGNSSLDVKGNYTYNYSFVGVPLPNVTETITDPITISHSLSGFKSTVGARLNLAFFKIFADYSFQEYNTVNAGIAFSFN